MRLLDRILVIVVVNYVIARYIKIIQNINNKELMLIIIKILSIMMIY